MTRFLARLAVVVTAVVCAGRLQAQMTSTHCQESEVLLDATHSAARLDRCGDDIADELLWHLDRIDQQNANLDGRFDPQNGGAGSVIYVMDTGVMARHTEFTTQTSSRVIAGFDATSSLDLGRSRCASANKATAPCYEDFDELAASSHGTAVASIAGGRNVGVAPEAMLVSIRVMNERGLATTRTYMDGLDAIIKHAWDPSSPSFRTAVVNISGWVLERLNGASNSVGGVVTYAALEQRMREMIGGVDVNGHPDPNGKRFVFVIAANNTDGGCGASGFIDRFPATLGSHIAGMITVGGMTPSNTAWSGTCRGGVEVLAPAQGIFCASITAADQYRGRRPNLRSGTSFAAPVISGIAARLLADRPDLTPQQIESWITSTPSRVIDAEPTLANGKVAYVRSIAPAAPMASIRASLEP